MQAAMSYKGEKDYQYVLCYIVKAFFLSKQPEI